MVSPQSDVILLTAISDFRQTSLVRIDFTGSSYTFSLFNLIASVSHIYGPCHKG